MKFKNVLKELRETLKLNQSDFAKKLGINQATVSRWESGHSAPSPLAYEKISRMLKKVNPNGE